MRGDLQDQTVLILKTMKRMSRKRIGRSCFVTARRHGAGRGATSSLCVSGLGPARQRIEQPRQSGAARRRWSRQTTLKLV